MGLRHKARAQGRGLRTALTFNGRFRAECLNAHWFLTLADAAEKLEDWRRYYNEVRPHGAIGHKVDTSIYRRFDTRQGRFKGGNGVIAARAVVSIVADDASRRFWRRGVVFGRPCRHAGAVRPWCQTKRVRL